MICFTVAEKLDRELFTTSILFTFFQTFPGRLERDVMMAMHIAISFANISYSAQAQVYDSWSSMLLPALWGESALAFNLDPSTCTVVVMSCLVNMSSDVMSYASQSGHAIYRGSRGIGLEKNLRCSLVFEQNLQF